MNHYKQIVPAYKDDVTVMIVPCVNWGGSYITQGEREYLALGVDLYLKHPEMIASKLNQLVTHELFHDYHAQVRGVATDNEKYLKEGKLYWQLWDEGMATWGEGFINRNQSYQYVMLSDYSQYDTANDARLAVLFLEEIDNPAIDNKNPVNYKKWFGVDSQSIGKNLPPSIGYYLGWKVINNLKQSGVPDYEFMSWDYEQAKPYIVRELNRIAGG